MKKTNYIFTIFILLVLAFIFNLSGNFFQKINTLSKQGQAQEKQEYIMKLGNSAYTMKNIFIGLQIAAVFSALVAIFFLIKSIMKVGKKGEKEYIPPFENYLFQLKSEEGKLKEELQKSNQKLAKEEALSKEIIQKHSSGIIFISNADRILIFNPAASDILEIPLALAIHNNIELLLQKIPELKEIYKKDNSPKSINYMGKTLQILYTNIKEGHVLEIKDNSKEMLRQTKDKYIMLGESASFLSHEFKNSLSVVYGYIASIKNYESFSNYKEKISKEIQLMNKFLDRFRDYTSNQNSEIKEINLKNLIKNINLSKKINIIIDIKDELTIKSDEIILTSILENLFLNASEAGASEIKISVKTIKDNYLQLEIINNGEKLPKSIEDKMFLPFFTTKENGTGMGLALCNKNANILNGRLELSHSSDENTSFILSLRL